MKRKKQPTASKAARGYGPAHQAERKRWKPVVEAGNAYCTRCRRQILPGMAWDLDHAPGKIGYLGAAHRSCNRRAGGRVGAALTNAKRKARKGVSRRW